MKYKLYLCARGKVHQTLHHILQSCEQHNPLSQRTWPDPSPLQKLYGDAENLKQTAGFVREIGADVRANEEDEEAQQMYKCCSESVYNKEKTYLCIWIILAIKTIISNILLKAVQ